MNKITLYLLNALLVYLMVTFANSVVCNNFSFTFISSNHNLSKDKIQFSNDVLFIKGGKVSKPTSANERMYIFLARDSLSGFSGRIHGPIN